jgi:integrase
MSGSVGGSVITNLKPEKMEVRYSAARIAKGAPRESGSHWYKVTGSVTLGEVEVSRLKTRTGIDYPVGYYRICLALKTDSEKIARVRVEDIKNACAIGADASLWQQLQENLPTKTFNFFAFASGFESAIPSPEGKSLIKKATWLDLRRNFISHIDRLISLGLVRLTSKQSYESTLRRFDEFIIETNLPYISQITESVIVEQFKPWRKVQILKSKNAGKNAERIKLDLTILRSVFNFDGPKMKTRARAWYASGFQPFENPVPKIEKDQKPGAFPEERTMPFGEDDQNRLRQEAAKMSYKDSRNQKYTLKHGSYLLAFELLLHTGLRRSDAMTMTWRQVRTDLGMVVLRTKKNGQEVMIRIHKDLLPALKSEYARQTKDGKPPKLSDCVLLNPETGNPYSRSGLNRSLGSLGDRLNIEEVRPHRFRCTFAVECLLKGLDVHRTAEYLGDTVKTVVEHYLPMSNALSQQAGDILDRDLPATRPAVTVEPAAPDTNLMLETGRRDNSVTARAWTN